MKKYKIILIIICVVIGFILFDTLQAILLNHSPILGYREKLDGNGSWVDRGILINTFYCIKKSDSLNINWELKKTKFACPIDSVSNEHLEKVNNQITEYFAASNVEYKNMSFNYVDVDNNVVIVGLIDNSLEKQQEFKKLVVDSEFINFVKANPNINQEQSEENKEETSNITINKPDNNKANVKTYTKEIIIDNYIGSDYLSVKENLESKGLLVSVEKTKSNEPENIVVFQSLAPGKYNVKIRNNEIIEGIKSITIKIPEKTLQYPNFTDGTWSVEDVEDFAETYELTVQIEEIETSDYEEGTIFYQSKPEGYDILKGTSFKIKVAVASNHNEEESDIW